MAEATENEVTENETPAAEDAAVEAVEAPAEPSTAVAADSQEVEDQVNQAIKEVEQAKAITSAPVKPKLFLKGKERKVIEVDVLFRQDNGEVLSVFSTDVQLDLNKVTKFLGHERLIFEFTQPQYSQMTKYRQRSTTVDPQTNMTVIDNLKLRDFLIIYHMKEWNLTDEDGESMEMKFDPNGALADETLEVVYSLHPSIIDVVMTTLERKLLMT